MNKELLEIYIKQNIDEMLKQKKLTEAECLFLLKKNIYLPAIIYKENTNITSSKACMSLLLQENPNEYFNIIEIKIIDSKIISILQSKNYNISKEDLQKNQNLFQVKELIFDAIEKDPSLIKYINQNTDYYLVEKALKLGYIPTEQDLIDNPCLCGFSCIIKELEKENPHFKNYYSNFCKNEKVEIIQNVLLSENPEKVEQLPFLTKTFGGRLSQENILPFLSSLTLEMNNYEQKDYFYILDKIIDGAVNIRYQNSKKGFIYQNIDDLADDLKDQFDNVIAKNDLPNLKYIANCLVLYINNEQDKSFVEANYLFKKLSLLFEQYKQNKKLDTTEATSFFNEILNRHANCFKSLEKKRIISHLKIKIPLSEKRKKRIFMGKKLEKMTKLIHCKNFNQIDELTNKVRNLRPYINSLKKLKKLNIMIDNETFEKIEDLFLEYGKIDDKALGIITNIKIPKILVFIANKYNQTKMEFADSIELTELESAIQSKDIENIGWNYNDYLIGNTEYYKKVLAKILINVNDERVLEILKSKNEYAEILSIIPFVNMLPEYGVDELISILINYSRSKKRILKGSDSFNELLTHFDKLIKISKGYDSMNDIALAVLGKRANEKLSMENASAYLNLYLKMFNRKEGYIPQISGHVNDNIIYESGNYQDVERLLVGANLNHSCIDLNMSGEKAYLECLNANSGDIMMFYKKKNKDFFGRMLMFRRGNIVMLAPILPINETIKDLYTTEFFRNIATQILEASKVKNDNIDYVFFTKTYMDLSDFSPFYHPYFNGKFPHADINVNAYLIGASQEDIHNADLSKMDVGAKHNIKYVKPRNPIKYAISEEEASRMKALRIILEKDINLKEELSRNYEPFNKEEYKYLIVGQDWYMGVRKDNTIDQVIIPTTDKRAILEIKAAKQELECQKDIGRTL